MKISDWKARLGHKASAGSKPRCHFLTNGTPAQVAARLTALVAPHATISEGDAWMPQGFDDLEEAQLHKAPRLLPEPMSTVLRDWWLAEASRKALTPNFDIASTCSIAGRRGVLLVEAKAHLAELEEAAIGRKLTESRSDAKPDPRALSHGMIGKAIAEAQVGLASATGVDVRISRDCCYQMSNRFAWAWKLTQLGFPVVLVYLGFLNATEMAKKSPLFTSSDDWSRAVLEHSAPLFPAKVWNAEWRCNGQPLIPLIRSVSVTLP